MLELLGLDSFFLQTTVPESINTLILSVTGLITAVSVAIGAIIKQRATGRDLTQKEKQIVSALEYAQLAAQKGKENIGDIGELIKSVYDSLPEESKAAAKEKLQPILDASSERIQITEEQIALFSKILNVNVDSNAAIPRESKTVLNDVNSAVAKTKVGIEL